MSEPPELQQQGNSSQLAIHFANWIAARASKHKDTVAMTARLLSEKAAEGHVCIDLSTIQTSLHLKDWKQQLQEVTTSNNSPLILDQNRLYLYRHWCDECRVAECINRLRQQPDTSIKANTDHITDSSQRKAVEKAIRKSICLISGGPGTGKTTTMVHILELLHKQDSKQVIKLAAPTGRAVARMKKVIASHNQQAEALTLHRLLGIRPGRAGASHATPVDADVLIVDEASMVSLELMARLMSSIQPGSRLILIGDRNQLYSVAAGSVFSDICQQHSDDITAHLTTNYRFQQDSGIDQLAKSITAGDADQAIAILKNNTEDIKWIQDYNQLQQQLHATAQRMWCKPTPNMQELEQARILAITREGSTGTHYINQYIENIKPDTTGRQIIITTNSEYAGLYNGDIGILADNTATFPDNKTLPQTRIPSHEPAWAMTVHKSQGSEFNHITLVTPPQPHRLMSRELLYTAITRARHSITIVATEQTIRHATDNPITRMSGLSDRINTA